MAHPIRECVTCHEDKPIVGQERCGKCYNQYRQSPEFIPKGKTFGKKLGPRKPTTITVPKEAKRTYNKKPVAPPVAVNTSYQELYALKGLMLAVVDFIHGKLETDALLNLLKENGYEA